MKNIFQIKKRSGGRKPLQQEKKRTYNWKREPVKPEDVEEDVTIFDICRIMPTYVANNFDVFETLPVNKLHVKPKNWKAYVDRIKQKIACFKSEFLL